MSNTIHAVYELLLSFLYLFATFNHKLKSDFSSAYREGDRILEHLCQHKLDEMTGDKLWQIYAAFSNPNFRTKY